MEQEYLNTFDNNFNTSLSKSVDYKKLKFLKNIFENFDELLYTPSSKYRDLRKEHINSLDELRVTLTKKQINLLNKCLEIGNYMVEEEQYQLFIYGCLTGYQLKEELEVK